MGLVFSHDFEDNSLAAYSNDHDPTLAAISTVRAYSGTRSARFNITTPSPSRLRRALTAGPTFGISLRYWREDTGDATPLLVAFAGTSPADVPLIWLQNLTFSGDELLLRCNSGGGDVTLDGSGEGTLLTVGAWTLLELAVDLSANPWKAKWRVDGVDKGEHTHAAAADDMVEFIFGAWGSAWTQWDGYADDVLVVDTYDFPSPLGKAVIPRSRAGKNQKLRRM